MNRLIIETDEDFKYQNIFQNESNTLDVIPINYQVLISISELLTGKIVYSPKKHHFVLKNVGYIYFKIGTEVLLDEIDPFYYDNNKN